LKTARQALLSPAPKSLRRERWRRRVFLSLWPGADCRVLTAALEIRLADSIVPAKGVFVHECPQETETDRQSREGSREGPVAPRRNRGRLAVERTKLHAHGAHARRTAAKHQKHALKQAPE